MVGRPRFEDLKFDEDKPLTCKATFEIYPEIELKQYKELEVEEETPQVTEADIDQAIEERPRTCRHFRSRFGPSRGG